MPAPALSTWCRAAGEAPDDFCARARTLGAAGLALDATLDAAWVEQLLAGRGYGVPVVVLEAPCPRPRAARLPRLCSADREERKAAVEQVTLAMETAARLGARAVVARLGRLDVNADWADTVRRFARGELDEELIEAQLALRVRLAPRALDQARFALEVLCGRAAVLGVTLALPNRARWFELPDDADVGVLLEDFRGGPLAPWHDAAAAHARGELGYSRHADTLAALGKRAAGAWLADASGLQGGLPWGKGEVDRAAVLAALSDEAMRVVHCTPIATDDELLAALQS